MKENTNLKLCSQFQEHSTYFGYEAPKNDVLPFVISLFFKASVEIDKVKSVMVDSFPENVQKYLFHRNAQQNTVLVASSACVHGIKYSADMVVSVGSCSGLPDFRQITKIVVINTEILFVCRLMTSWYHEHFRAYELCGNHLSTVSVTELCELNDPFPLSLYKVKGRQLITLKRYILC